MNGAREERGRILRGFGPLLVSMSPVWGWAF